jgi:hypothetical protein
MEQAIHSTGRSLAAPALVLALLAATPPIAMVVVKNASGEAAVASPAGPQAAPVDSEPRTPSLGAARQQALLAKGRVEVLPLEAIDETVFLENDLFNRWMWQLGWDHSLGNWMYGLCVAGLAEDRELVDALRRAPSPPDLTDPVEQSSLQRALMSDRARRELDRLLAEAEPTETAVGRVLEDLSSYLRAYGDATVCLYDEHEVDRLWAALREDYEVLAPVFRDYELLRKRWSTRELPVQVEELERPQLWSRILAGLEQLGDKRDLDVRGRSRWGDLARYFGSPYALMDEDASLVLHEEALWTWEPRKRSPCLWWEWGPKTAHDALQTRIRDLQALEHIDLPTLAAALGREAPDLDQLSSGIQSRICQGELLRLRSSGWYSQDPSGRRALLTDCMRTCAETLERIKLDERPLPCYPDPLELRIHLALPTEPLIVSVFYHKSDDRDATVGTRVLDRSLDPSLPALVNYPDWNDTLVVLQLVDGTHLAGLPGPYAGVLRGGVYQGSSGPQRASDAAFAEDLKRLITQAFVEGPARGRLSAEALHLIATLGDPSKAMPRRPRGALDGAAGR